MPAFEQPNKENKDKVMKEAERLFELWEHEQNTKEFNMFVPAYKLLADYESRTIGEKNSVRTSVQEFRAYSVGTNLPPPDALDRINSALKNDVTFTVEYLKMQIELHRMDLDLARETFEHFHPNQPIPQLLMHDE